MAAVKKVMNKEWVKDEEVLYVLWLFLFYNIVILIESYFLKSIKYHSQLC